MIKKNILCEVKNNLGIIILDRAEALNALNTDMFLILKTQLEKWQCNASIKAVLIKSNCKKVFCAGGDIREIYHNRHASLEKAVSYFKLEYEVNSFIDHYSKPYISFLNGLTMGGGAGISIHGSHPIGTENLQFAMPETKIGYFPDVGVSYHLSRLPDAIGIYLGLTGNTINVADSNKLNLIKYFIPEKNLESLEKKLIETNFKYQEKEIVSEIIYSFSKEADDIDLLKKSNIIKNCFLYDTVEKIFEALKNNPDEFAKETLHQLNQRSPTSLKVALLQLQKAKCMDFNQVIEMDWCIAKHMLLGHDFFEGIRAMIIDKDKNPHWHPFDIADVTESMVLHYFSGLKK